MTIPVPVEQCVLFHRTDEEVKAVREVFGLTEKSVQDGVDTIMEWLQKQPHLVHLDISRPVLEMMILVGKGSVERTKGKIDNYYKYRFLLPEFFQNRKQILCGPNKVWDLLLESYDQNFNFGQAVVVDDEPSLELPPTESYRDINSNTNLPPLNKTQIRHYLSINIFALPKLQDNKRIHIVKFGEYMNKFDIEEFFRRLVLLLELRMIYDYMAGDIWIIDMEHVGWVQILTQNPLVFKKITTFFTKALNWRIFGIHVINIAAPANIIQRIVDFFKQFITSIIMDRVVIHGSLEDLYKYVPKECLPEDYGGNELNSQKLVGCWARDADKFATEFWLLWLSKGRNKEITENFYKNPKITEFLLECSKMVSNESLRPRDENSEEFLSGTFRQLEVD